MDNLTAHKGERVRELIEGRECELLYLPPYSPDFNPIEEAFAKIKGVLRKAEARTREALWWRRWVQRSLQSVRTMREASSSIAVTVHEFNYYDQCCRRAYADDRQCKPLRRLQPCAKRVVSAVVYALMIG
jgi:hypothetical protein